MIQNNFVVPGSRLNKQNDLADQFIEKWAQRLANENTRFIGISVFSYFSQLAAYMLSEKIKAINPNMKIVVGGAGCNIRISEAMFERYQVTSGEKLMKFGEVLKRRGLVDHVIIGDGELALTELLAGRELNFDSFQMIDYKMPLPFSNFDDFDLSQYSGHLRKDYPQLPVFTSKGCVRNCDFCDVKAVQNRFRFRSGKNIVEEMLFLANRYNIREFVFLDSLVNGSLKSLTEWVTELAAYNRANPDKRIVWSGNWICRPKGQIKEPFYQLLAESGCDALSIGAESGSNHVLKNMDKKTNVESLFYEVELFKKHNIKFQTLMIVGHWSERWQDFVDTCDMLYRLSLLARTGTYVSLNVGPTFNLLTDTPADLDKQDNQLRSVSPDSWWTPVNPSLTVRERLFRLLLIYKFCKKLNLPLQVNVLPFVYQNLLKSLEKTQQFYRECTQDLVDQPTQYAEHYLNNFDSFMNLVANNNQACDEKIAVEIEIQSHVVNSNPRITVSWNNKVEFDCLVPEGSHTLKFELNTSDSNKLAVKFSNKQPNDTIVDEQGNIVQDKYVEIKKFIVNGVDFVQDSNFFYRKLHYAVNGVPDTVSAGFWFNNSEISLEFNQPFTIWYNSNSDKNAVLSSFIISKSILPKELSSETEEYYRDQIIKLLRTMDY